MNNYSGSAAKVKPYRKKMPFIFCLEKSSSNKKAKEALNQMKQEAANTVGVNLKQGYNGDITARQAGSIGGEMVKRMIENYESGHSAK